MSEILGLGPEGIKSPEREFLRNLWWRFPRSERPFLSPEKAEAEARGMVSAYQYVDALLARQNIKVDEETIKEIHRKICHHRDGICSLYEDEGLDRPIGGIYWIGGKKVVGASFEPVSAKNFYPKLEELVGIFSQVFESLPTSTEKIPVKVRQAADVHRRLIHLHPFPDANGRVAAVLSDLILMRAGFPQIPIWLPKEEYYQVISSSIEEDRPEPLERFLGERVLWGCSILMAGLKKEGSLRQEARKTSDLGRIEEQIMILSQHYGPQA